MYSATQDMQWREQWLKKPIPGKRFGQLQSLLTGGGVSFHDTRRYQSGDARKHINRKLSAKHQHRYVNTQEHERLSELFLFLDSNANRRGGIERPWMEVLTQRLADLALVTQALHTKVYVTIPTHDGLQHIEVRSLLQWSVVMDMLQVALKQSPTAYTTALPQYRSYFATHTKQRLVVLVSDFLDGQEELLFFQQYHQVVPICLPVPMIVTAQGPWWVMEHQTREQQQGMLFLDT